MGEYKIKISNIETNSTIKELHRERNLPDRVNDITIRENECKVFTWPRHDEKLDFLNEMIGIKGVYVIYNGVECIYVGQTGAKLGIKNRLRYHKRYKDFVENAKVIVCYEVNEKNDRLLFERIKISQLNPKLNADEKGTAEERTKLFKESVEERVWNILNELAYADLIPIDLSKIPNFEFDKIKKEAIDSDLDTLEEEIMKMLKGESFNIDMFSFIINPQ